MTITERYLKNILSSLSGVHGGMVLAKMFKGRKGYEFPCPFCSSMQKKEYKKRSRCAALIPHPESFSYTFNCCRKHSGDCMRAMSFPNFLRSYDPVLFKKYHLEREQNGTTGKGHNLERYEFLVKV